jgi:hypothetical protein
MDLVTGKKQTAVQPKKLKKFTVRTVIHGF